MKILVTDVSGSVGRRLMSDLQSAGHEVVGFRKSETGDAPDPAVRTWPTRADSLARALTGLDVVFALDLAEISGDQAGAAERRLQKLVIASAKAGVSSFVLLSRGDVFDPDILSESTARETSRLCAPETASLEVAASLKVEQVLRDAGLARWSILRAPVLLAPDSHRAKELFRSILIDEAGSPARFHGVDSADVAKALTGLCTAPRAERQVFNVAAPQALPGSVLDQELGRLARLLNDEAVPEDKLRPDYEVAEPVLATDKLARLVGISAEKSVWTSLAETMQQLMKDLRADGTLEPLPEKISVVAKAVETGAKPLSGKVAVITGVTTGIGRATSLLLSRLGATVVGIARNAERGAELMTELEENRHLTPGFFFQSDLMSLSQIRKLAEDLSHQFPKIDILINNAGANFTTRRLTEDGYEATFALNHLAPFLLTNLLAEPLKAADAARIIMVSSDWHRRSHPDLLDLQMASGYRSIEAYCRAKFLNLQITYVMAVLLEGTRVTVNAIHPGVVRTGISTRNNEGGPTVSAQARERAHQRMISAEASAVYLATLATSDEFAGKTGLYLDTDEVKASDEATYDEDLAWHVWELTARMTGLSDQQQEETGTGV